MFMKIKKLKILYVITQGEWGGAQRYIFDLATNLADDFDVTVAVGEKQGKTDLQKKLGNWETRKLKTTDNKNTEYRIQNIGLKHLKRNISPIHDILAVFELAKLYRNLKPDIVHLNSSKAGILGSLAKFVCQIFG